MTTLLQQAELSLAAYGRELAPSNSESANLNPDKLKEIGMPLAQAQQLLGDWEVVEQFNSGTGASATLFKLKASDTYAVAVRGTEISASDLGADGMLAVGWPKDLNPQFIALKGKVAQWLAAAVTDADGNSTPAGPLHGHTFTVSGHSLGGYSAGVAQTTEGGR